MYNSLCVAKLRFLASGLPFAYVPRRIFRNVGALFPVHDVAGLVGPERISEMSFYDLVLEDYKVKTTSLCRQALTVYVAFP
jgi:hypothetical protein